MLKQDRPRVLYVAIMAAVMALASIVAANSARADDWIDIRGNPIEGNAATAAESALNAAFAAGTMTATPVVYGSGVPYLPDPAKTPGAVYPDDEATICGKVDGLTYEKRSRASLTQAVKNAITRSYGQEPGQDGDHELDHRVPAALGGKSDASNVWWQPGRDHGTAFDFHVKDRLDTFAWRQVCVRHAVPLDVAQAWFMEPDWTKVYCREMGGPPCP